jgi:acetylornithine deacetylase/succinyl-diaminopimelate desuccinylase-like protein
MLAEILKMAEATSAVNPGVQFAIDVTNDKPPLVTAPDAELIRSAKAAARHVLGAEPAVRGAPYLTDGSLLAGTTATPAIVCGPGPQEMAHQVDEYLETSELIRAFRFYCALAMAYLE